MSNRLIELNNLTKEYKGVTVLDHINLYIRENEFITLLGPSGCGKTTTLRLIGGFEYPTEGEILFDGKKINDVPPYKRNINTVFQKYALFTHLNVYDNVAFGLRIKKFNSKTIDDKVKQILKLVALEGFEKRDIDSLSGGQQQRVAIARALINEPKVLLLDEPLGALDLKLRKEMQIELMNIQKRVGITFVYVTHDQEEALTMSDTIVVMNHGKVQQIGTPVDIYNEPSNRFVADFIGESNIIEGIMRSDFKVEFGGEIFTCVDKGFENNEEIDVVLRPEDLKLVTNDNAKLKGRVKSVVFKGVHYEMIVENDLNNYTIHSTRMYSVGTTVGINIAPEDIHVMKRREHN